MKLDDRDITCERSYDPLTPAELMEEIDLYTDIALNSPLRDSAPEEILGPARALLARVEAAEAEKERLTARMAVLEAELAAVKAAGEWRPVTEDWPHYHDRVAIGQYGGHWTQFACRVQNDDDDEWLLDDGRLDFESASVAILLPSLPSAPQEEPTP